MTLSRESLGATRTFAHLTREVFPPPRALLEPKGAVVVLQVPAVQVEPWNIARLLSTN